MKRKIINISIWIIAGIVLINAIWFLSFIVSVIFKLDTLIPQNNTFYLVFIGSSFITVLLATLLNITLNLSIIAEVKAKEGEQNNKQVFGRRGLSYLAIIFVVIIGLIFLVDFYKKHQERNLIINNWTEIINEYNRQVDDISESICDTSRIKNLPQKLKDLSSHRFEKPYLTIIGAETIKDELEFIEISSSFLDSANYDSSAVPTVYQCVTDERQYLKKIFTTKSSEKYLWTDKGSFRLFYPIDKGKRKYILLFVHYEDSYYRHGE